MWSTVFHGSRNENISHRSSRCFWQELLFWHFPLIRAQRLLQNLTRNIFRILNRKTNFFPIKKWCFGAWNSIEIVPWRESYFKRCARILASARELIATTWISFRSKRRWRFRPIRPYPLIPILSIVDRKSDEVCRYTISSITLSAMKKMGWFQKIYRKIASFFQKWTRNFSQIALELVVSGWWKYWWWTVQCV